MNYEDVIRAYTLTMALITGEENMLYQAMTYEQKAKHRVAVLITFWVLVDPVYARYVSYETVLRGVRGGGDIDNARRMLMQELLERLVE